MRGSELEIAIKVPFLQPGAFLVQNPITIAATKAERFPGRLTPQQLALVENGFRDWLGLYARTDFIHWSLGLETLPGLTDFTPLAQIAKVV